MLPINVRYYGVEDDPPEQIQLRAGPLSLVYENGDLRYIRLGDREIVRRLYVALRDHNWDTIGATLSNEQIAIGDNTFQISYDATHVHGAIDFVWHATISGEADGTIRFAMDGAARSTFRRNRIGFCLLHPMDECAGAPCVVEHSDGGLTRSTFPQQISPHQPFFDMRAISHEVSLDLWVDVRFAGDIFEMEDQRNWTDASFKTYCTPLGLPFPVQVAAGTRITQSVEINMRGEGLTTGDWRLATGDRRLVTFSLHPSSFILPQIGLASASHGQPLSEHEIVRLRSLNLAHVRVDLDLFSSGWVEALGRATSESNALAVPLEVALTLSDDAERELEQFVSTLVTLRPKACRWLIFHRNEKSTRARWVDLARAALAQYDPAIPVGAGASAYFTELNRERPAIDQLDLVCYSLNPQVHAFDNASLVETLAAQATTVASARAFSSDLPIAVTSVTLRPRFNPNATGPEPEPVPGELPAQVDARQMSLFGAGWTLGSLKHLLQSGAASLTYYETTGWRGVMETAQGSPLPERFRSFPGGVFPLYHVLADVGEFVGGQAIVLESSDPLHVEGLALRKDGCLRILLANLAHQPEDVIVTCEGASATVRMLDATNVEAAMRDPEGFRQVSGETIAPLQGKIRLTLPAYAIARIDLHEEKSA